MIKASILISTVGSSLFNNIGHDKGARYPELYAHRQREEWTQVARVLRSLDPLERICGAEINSVHALRVKGRYVERDAALYFLVSDTDDGAAVGAVLKSYYGLDVRNIRRIDGLDDADAARFRRLGLRSLVEGIAAIAKSAGDLSKVAINPLGGYKAEIAVAGLVGQVLGVPVFYKYEGADVLVMPPMPITLDDSLYLEHTWLFSGLGRSKTVDLDDEDMLDERLLPLLEVVEEGGRRLVSLGYIGELYVDGYEALHPQGLHIPRAATEAQRKEPTFRDDNYPEGFKQWVSEVWRSCPFAKSAHSVDYDGQKAIKHGRFTFGPSNDSIVGEYQDRSKFGARFALTTTATTRNEIIAILRDLNSRYGGRAA